MTHTASAARRVAPVQSGASEEARGAVASSTFAAPMQPPVGAFEWTQIVLVRAFDAPSSELRLSLLQCFSCFPAAQQWVF